jgi:hypothetical protein
MFGLRDGGRFAKGFGGVIPLSSDVEPVRWCAGSERDSVSVSKRALHPVVLWGMVVILGFIGRGIYRLSLVAWELTSGRALSPLEVGFLIVWGGFMVYSEGYKGFHKAFSPRVVLRLHLLAERPTPVWAFLAPVVGMGLLRATRKRLIVSWCLVLGIVGLVLFISQLSYPYRSIIDLGVVMGLTVGSASLVYHYLLALRGHLPDMEAELTGMDEVSAEA